MKRYEKIQSAVFQVGSTLVWEQIGPGIERQIMGYNNRIMLVNVKFKEGASGHMHKHPHSQTTCVVSELFEVTVGDEKKVLKSGDGFYFPPQVMHGAICLDDGLLIDVFSPHREEFLDGSSVRFMQKTKSPERYVSFICAIRLGSGAIIQLPEEING